MMMTIHRRQSNLAITVIYESCCLLWIVVLTLVGLSFVVVLACGPKVRHRLRMKKRFVQAALDMNQNVSEGSRIDSVEQLMEQKIVKPREVHRMTLSDLKRLRNVKKATLKK